MGFSKLEVLMSTPDVRRQLTELNDDVRLTPSLIKMAGVRWPRIPTREQKRDALVSSLYQYVSGTMHLCRLDAIVVLENQGLTEEFGPISWQMVASKPREKRSVRIARLGLEIALHLASRLGSAQCFVLPAKEEDEGQLMPFEEAIEAVEAACF